MIESLAAGTPVIALRRGSVPEVIEDGVTGFICDDVDEMVQGRRADRRDRPRGVPSPRRAVLRRGDVPGLRRGVRGSGGRSERRRAELGGRPTRAPLPSLGREARRRHPRVGPGGSVPPHDGQRLGYMTRRVASGSVLLVGPVVVAVLVARLVGPGAAS